RRSRARAGYGREGVPSAPAQPIQETRRRRGCAPACPPASRGGSAVATPPRGVPPAATVGAPRPAGGRRPTPSGKGGSLSRLAPASWCRPSAGSLPLPVLVAPPAIRDNPNSHAKGAPFLARKKRGTAVAVGSHCGGDVGVLQEEVLEWGVPVTCCL